MISLVSDSEPYNLKYGDIAERPYFFGLHDHWIEIKENPFESDGWISHCEALVRKWSNDNFLFHGEPMHLKAEDKNALPAHLAIPLLKIKELLNTKSQVHILDIGGGFGDNYYYLARSLGLDRKRIIYHVVDNAKQRNLGQRIFSGSQNIYFFNEPPEKHHYDLTLLIGTLQYINDYKNLFILLTRVSSFIFLTRTPIRISGPSFFTVQTICPLYGNLRLRVVGQAVVRVIGQTELTEFMEKMSYQLEKSVFFKDYSINFTRLPLPYQHVAYVNQLWKKQITQ